jgi:hypothetical protein
MLLNWYQLIYFVIKIVQFCGRMSVHSCFVRVKCTVLNENVSGNVLKVTWEVGQFIQWVLVADVLFRDQSVTLALCLYVDLLPEIHLRSFVTWL